MLVKTKRVLLGNMYLIIVCGGSSNVLNQYKVKWCKTWLQSQRQNTGERKESDRMNEWDFTIKFVYAESFGSSATCRLAQNGRMI